MRQLLVDNAIQRNDIVPRIHYSIIEVGDFEKCEKPIDMILQFWSEYNTENITRYKLIERLRNSHSKIVLATEKGLEIIGFGVFSSGLLPLTNKLRIEMHALFVKRDNRLMGIGRSIVKEIVVFGKNIGCKSIFAPQGIDRFYEKIGFRRIASPMNHDFVYAI